MYRDIEEIYKKKSPYNIIKKNVFDICCIYIDFINFQFFK